VKNKNSNNLYNYLNAKTFSLQPTFNNEQVLSIFTKTPHLLPNNKVINDLGAAAIQMKTNFEYEKPLGFDEAGVVVPYPTVFTLKTNLYNYLTKQLFSAYASGSNTSGGVYYHYSDTTRPSYNIHTANNYVQTPFLSN